MPIQSAAIPYRFTAAGELEILLVTSRRKGRWVCPKGKVKAGYSASLSAAEEAFEEGGVLGTVTPTAVAVFEKMRSRGGIELVIPVHVFPLLVETEASLWPEMEQRTRRWMTLPQALHAVEDSNLREALLCFGKRFDAPS